MLPSFTMFSAAALASFLSLVSAAPLEKRAPSGPVISSNFPDPSIIKVGGTWYSFGTNLGDSTVPHVQIATSTDFKTWTLTGDDALPNLPAWVATGTPAVWAPDVIQNDNGNFVMYFSAARAANAARHCVGVATSDTITGPYTAQSTAWVCHNDQGGSIDASSFVDSDGSRYVTYKIDGNSQGSGGACNNENAPIKSTPIMQQKVGSNGIDKVGDPYQILTNSDSSVDGPDVEAPSIAKFSDGRYVLFFSSNCYTTINYNVNYATASSVSGPYTRASTPLFTSSSTGLWSPGGASIAPDGQHLVFHAYIEAGSSIRAMYTAQLSWNDNVASA
ncbi:putative endo-arabinase [Phyllosticta capitalensis]|uniref:Endo-arabinase n=2 Tax=Phyllosticta capitalensis TaxID=121624 RepID=A0ABR1Z3X8_9PEZI